IRVGGAAIFLLSAAAPLCTSSAQEPDKNDSLVVAPTQQSFTKPGALTFIKNFPGDIADYSRITFRRKNAGKIGEMVIETAVLIKADQTITDRAYSIGDRLDLSHSSHQKTYAHLSLSVDGKRLQLPIAGPDN